MSDHHYFLLQVNDALFPIGAYSHSQGLETYIQKGIVHDTESAAWYLHHKLEWNLAYTEILGAKLAYEYALAENITALNELEEIMTASRIPMEQREASRKMGSRFIKTIRTLPLPLKENNILHQYMESRQNGSVNQCIVYGAFCASLGIPLKDTLSHYLYAQTSAMVTNCVKTIPLSQTAGQRLLSSCFDLFDEILENISNETIDSLCLSAPGFDVRGIQHEKLYSRLYMS